MTVAGVYFMLKRHLSLILCIVVLASVILAGCSDNSTPSSNNTHATTQPAQAPTDTESSQIGDSAQGNQQDSTQDGEDEASSVYTKALVVRAIDGDTIEVKHLAGPELPATKVRLIGVNTPESTTRVEPYGKEAAAFTKRQLEGKTVWLEKDLSETDRYGRALRYVWLAEPPSNPTFDDARKSMFNAKLVAEGYAQVATFPPDVKYADLFVQLQREAREADKGLWGIDTSGSSAKKSSGSSSTAKKTSGSTQKSSGSTQSKSTGDSRSSGSGMVKGTGGYDCPSGYPIKGNISSSGEKIYHVPSGQFYSRTKPEYCFKTTADAERAGFRASKR